MSDFAIENGVLVRYRGSNTHVVIPEGVTSIGYRAFSYCSNLTSVAIPDNVTNIGIEAFESCENLKNVVIPDSVTSISDGAFRCCSNLTSIVIPNSVINIGSFAFNKCSSLTSVVIPDSVTHIDIGAFGNCSNLKSITIPASVTSIGDCAFFGCRNLTSVVIPDSVTRIKASVFEETPWMAQQGDWVIAGKVLLKYLGNATNAIIPNNVAQIGVGAFSGCLNLTSVVIPDSVNIIGDNAFYGCEGLKSVVIPDSVTSIGFGAFCGCESLMSITIPNSVTSIDMETFEDCHELNLLQIPGCELSSFDPSLKSALVNGFATDPSVYSEERKAEYIKYMSGQKKKLLPKAVSQDDVSLLAVYEQFGIKLPPDLRDSLIDQATKENKKNALAWLLNFKNRTVNREQETKDKERTEEQQITNPYMIKFLKADWRWSKLENGTIHIDKYRGKDANVTIPPFVGKVPVTSIGDSAFYDCRNLESVVIPDGVTRIGDRAFLLCSNLTSIVIPNSVTSIADNSFSATAWLTQQGDLAIVCKVLLKYQGKENNVIIPDGVTRIGINAFYNCSNIENIVIPDSVTSIGSSAFADCGNLTSIIIPDSVTSIGDRVFSDCSSLTSISISGNVTSIERKTFEGCNALKILQIPGCELSSFDSSLKSVLVNGFAADPSVYSEERKTEYIKYISEQKKKLLPKAVTQENISLFSVYEQFGIKLPPDLRDELIEQATKEKKENVLAWLLDYKNRTTNNKR